MGKDPYDAAVDRATAEVAEVIADCGYRALIAGAEYDELRAAVMRYLKHCQRNRCRNQG